MFKPELLRQVARFGLVGGMVMLVFTGLNWLLAPWLGEDPAFLLAYVPAVGLHFCLNKWWTFGCGRSDTRRQLGQYLLTVLVTFVIQAGIFKLLTTFSPWPSWIAAGAANLGQMAVSFLCLQRRVFAPAGARQ
jgi:putative flippase GtrA